MKKHLGGYWKEIDPATYTPTSWLFLIELFEPKSIIDIGCGVGHSTKFFKDQGLDVIGVEGCKEAIQCLVPYLIHQHDYTEGAYVPPKEYDLAWACEFVEHIEEKYVPNFMETFKHAKTAVITHATPGQGGHHHVNCQEKSYWVDQFSKINYKINEDFTRMIRTVAQLEPHFTHLSRTGLVFVK